MSFVTNAESPTKAGEFASTAGTVNASCTHPHKMADRAAVDMTAWEAIIRVGVPPTLMGYFNFPMISCFVMIPKPSFIFTRTA